MKPLSASPSSSASSLRWLFTVTVLLCGGVLLLAEDGDENLDSYPTECKEWVDGETPCEVGYFRLKPECRSHGEPSVTETEDTTTTSCPDCEGGTGTGTGGGSGGGGSGGGAGVELHYAQWLVANGDSASTPASWQAFYDNELPSLVASGALRQEIPRQSQSIALGTNASGAPMGRLSIDMGSALLMPSHPLSLNLIKLHFQPGIDPADYVPLEQTINGRRVQQYSFPQMKVRLVEEPDGTLQLDCFSADSTPADLPDPAETDVLTSLSVSRSTNADNENAVEVEGTYLGQPYQSEFSGISAGNAGRIYTTYENGKKIVTTETSVADSSDLDGQSLAREVEEFKLDAVTQEWVRFSRKYVILRTLNSGEDKPIYKHIYVNENEFIWTTYTYDDQATRVVGGFLVANMAFGKLTSQDENGAWVKYEYDEQGRLWRTTRPWQDYPASLGDLAALGETNGNVGKVETRTYFQDHEDVSNEVEINTSINGQPLESGWVSVQEVGNELYRSEYKASLGQPYRNRTEKYEITADNVKKLVEIADDSGITMVSNHVPGALNANGLFVADANGNLTASIQTSIVDYQRLTLPLFSIRTVNVRNAAGQNLLQYRLLATTQAVPDEADYAVLDGVRYVYHTSGRLLERQALDGTPLESIAYDDLNNTRTTTDENGLVTTVVMNALGQEVARTRHAIAAAPALDLPAIAVLSEATARTEAGFSRVATIHTRLSGDLQQQRSVVTDAAGRTVLTMDEQGRTTHWVHTHGPDPSYPGATHRGVFKLRPGGEAYEWTTYFLDGSVAADFTETGGRFLIQRTVSGEGIAEGTTWHGGRWERTTRSSDGLLLKNEQPSPSAPETDIALTQYLYDYSSPNKPTRIERPGLAPIVMYYSMGELVSRRTILSGSNWLSSSDSLTEMTHSHEQAEGAWWKVMKEKRYTIAYTQGDEGALTREVWRKLGLSSGSYVKTIESDGRVIIDETVIDRAHALTTTTRTTLRNGVVGEVSMRRYRAGLLVSETQPGLPGVITHAYDGLGRRTQTIRPLIGTTTWAYNAVGQLLSTTNAAGQTTSHSYYSSEHPSAGRIQTTTALDGATTTYEYDLRGRVTLQSGTSGYRVAKTYTEEGQLATLTTWRNYVDASSTGDTTTWNYTPLTGLLASKVDASGQGVSYTYHLSGKLHTRTSARGVITTYQYNGDGALQSIDYSDDTPDVVYSHDRLNRPVSITDGSGTRALGYDCPCPTASATEYAEDALLPGLSVVFGHDAEQRRNSLSIEQNGHPLATTTYSYVGATERLASVALDGVTATYDWSTQVAGLPGTVSYQGGASFQAPTLIGHRTPDAAGRLDKIEWSSPNQPNLSSTDYTLDAAGRRTAAVREDGTRWDYGYNSKGEVTSAENVDPSGTALPARTFGYQYDEIGNRTEATQSTVNPPPQATTYAANELNQYTSLQRTNPLRKLIQGLAHEAADIEVRSFVSPEQAAQPASGIQHIVAKLPANGPAFLSETAANIGSGPAWRFIQITATRPGVGINGGAVTTKREGWLYFPPANETLTYDLDGNLTSDARWQYTWDGENRLIQMEEHADPAPRPALQRLTFAYDSQSRRIRKVVESRRDSNWLVTSDTRFLYDDWNLVGEFAMNPLQSSSLILQHSFAWGYDLSGTQQGAGGVGGLLLAKSGSQLSTQNSQLSALAPTYDGNGNLTAWIDVASGTAVQRMEYDAFGNELSLDSALVPLALHSLGDGGSTLATQLPAFGFSTKYTDRETGLCYYGYRYYSPELGRWTARDPIGERGGVNIFCLTANSAINRVDRLGLEDAPETNNPELEKCATEAEKTFNNCKNELHEAASAILAGLIGSPAAAYLGAKSEGKEECECKAKFKGISATASVPAIIGACGIIFADHDCGEDYNNSIAECEKNHPRHIP